MNSHEKFLIRWFKIEFGIATAVLILTLIGTLALDWPARSMWAAVGVIALGEAMRDQYILTKRQNEREK